jgi:hypothetical protein
MFQKLFGALANFYILVISLLVSVGLIGATWICWKFYEDVSLQSEFVEEGELRSVVVRQVQQEQRSWLDILGNSEYISFDYAGKPYTTRYVHTTNYIGEGDRVQLLYHPKYDAFLQPVSESHMQEAIPTSRLIGWTLFDMSTETKWLLFSLLLTSITFFFVSGTILKLVSIPFLQYMNRLLFGLELLTFAGFMSYMTWEYFQLYQHLKNSGQETTVRVLDAHRVSYRHSSRTRRRSSRSHYGLYSYEATIQYQQQKRVIPISEDDFETVKPDDTLSTYADKSMNEFMSVDYSPDYGRLLASLFCWVLAFFALFPSIASRKKTRQAVSS